MSSADPVLVALAERLAGARVLELTPCTGGGNNRVFRLVTDARTYALKVYRRSENDRRDRLGVEFSGLRYAWTVAPGRVPEPFAADAKAGIALYEFVVGDRVERHASAEIDQVLAFLEALHGGRAAPGTQMLPPASEAGLNPDDIREQIERRLALLDTVDGEPALHAFLAERFRPTYARFLPALAGVVPVRRDDRTLSPSDFGFHNALRRNGEVVFLDFEYFGWDDPAKLVCDFLWHPGMRLSENERGQFLAGAADVFKEGTPLLSRLHAFEPLIALRWATIVLGEFLPEVRERRRYAAGGDLERNALRAQLAKANAILDRLEIQTADRTAP
ncbi:MAG TPA: phosphotransferase [Candidatus Baltobacteraceae bacterium]|jgi:hypothetical protein